MSRDHTAKVHFWIAKSYFWATKRQICPEGPPGMAVKGHFFTAPQGVMRCKWCGKDWLQSQIILGLN